MRQAQFQAQRNELETRLAADLEAASRIIERPSEVIEALRFREQGAEAHLQGLFSDLTLFYPSILADDLGVSTSEFVESIQYVHFLFIIHTVLEDRLLDGQTRFVPDAYLLNKYISEAGWIKSLGAAEKNGLLQEYQVWATRLSREYMASQSQSLKAKRNGFETRVESLESLAARRGLLGFLSVALLSLKAKLSEQNRNRILTAYQSIVVALQWADDLEDWSEDQRLGNPNLVWASATRNASKGLPVRDSIENAQAQISLETFAYGIQTAESRFQQAIRLHDDLGLTGTADNIGGVFGAWLNRRDWFRNRMHDSILAEFQSV